MTFSPKASTLALTQNTPFGTSEDGHERLT